MNLLFLTAFYHSLALVAGVLQTTAPTIMYEVRLDNADHHEADITVVFTDVPAGVLELRMSRSSPGRYALHEFAKNVYDVLVTNVCGTITSDIAPLVVIDTPPTIDTHPEDQTVCEGAAATFSVDASGVDRSYQWYRNGVAIDGADQRIFTIDAVEPNDAIDMSAPGATGVGRRVGSSLAPVSYDVAVFRRER